MKDRMEGLVKPKNKDEVRHFHEKKIGSLLNKLESHDKKLLDKEAAITFLEKALLDDKVLAIPKVSRLSWASVSKIKSDILFVDDVNEFSEKAVEFLKKNRIRFIICNKLPSPKLQKKLPFPCVKAEKFEHSRSIVLVHKEWVDKISRDSQILRKVIEEYQKNRANV